MTLALVTGGAGFIGSHLVKSLRERGDEVRVLDNLSSGRSSRLSGLDVELIEADVRDGAAVGAAVEGVNWVFHLAALVSVDESMADPPRCYDVNLQGSVNIMEAARRAGIERVVLSSSCAVYGDTTQPAREADARKPFSPYASSKASMEDAARLYAQTFGLPAICLRYFNVYGPRQSLTSDYSAVIPKFIQAAQSGEPIPIDGDGLQTRDFVYVEDVVRANLLAAETEQEPGSVFNIGSGVSTSVLDLAEELQRIIGSESELMHRPPREGDIRFSASDLESAQRSLGYRPLADLHTGLVATVEWFRSGDGPPA